MIPLWKSVVLDVGVQGLQAHFQIFCFVENLGKSPGNPGKNCAQRCLTSRNGVRGSHKNTWRPFLKIIRKRDLHDLCGRKFVDKSCTKNFSDKFGEIWAKSFAPQRFACSYTYDENAPPRPLPFFWKGRGGNALAMPPFSGVPVNIIQHALFSRCCRLQCANCCSWQHRFELLRQAQEKDGNSGH